MNTRSIDYLNIFLMLVSCWLAFLLPFKLFLFSYAVLGPLHYLTEINWLHDRNYFTENKNDYKWLTVFGVVSFLGFLVYNSTQDYSILGSYLGTEGAQNSNKASIGSYMLTAATFLAFVCALAMIFFQKVIARLTAALLAIVFALILHDSPAFVYFIAFLPTLIHVLVFTGVFILYGALKNNSNSGLLSFLVFLFCMTSFFWIPYENSDFRIDQGIWNKYLSSGIHFINVDLIAIIDPNVGIDIFLSKLGLMVQRMIAFGYTYHYLNWFSKTSIIKWHAVPRKKLTKILLLWIVSVLLYWYSYELGVIVLIFLSMLHVFFEFPLNHKSMIGVARELGKKNVLKLNSYRK